MNRVVKRHPTGFTLIEMLVVIGIISILAGLLLAAIGTARRTAKEKAVEARLKLIEAALDRYEQDFKDYPPSEGDPEGVKGAASLLQCLKTEKKEGPYLTDPNIHTCETGGGGQGIADEWNHAIRYIHHKDYRNTAPNKHTFRLISAGPDGEYQNGASIDKTGDDIVNWNKMKPE